MSLPTVSVVIPCYNAERYIGATLRSVLDQAGAALEVIVVDDGSTDGSADLVARQFPQIKLLRVENGGVARARNFGIEAAANGSPSSTLMTFGFPASCNSSWK
jgi:glycosyltransferase involved in cell wall biosynthesis